MPKPNPSVITTQPPPGVPAAALAQCSHNHNGDPLLTYQGRRWIYTGHLWEKVPIPAVEQRQRGLLSIVVAAVMLVLAVGAVVGINMGKAPLERQLAQQQQKHLQDQLAQQQRATQTLQAAQQRGDDLTRQLAQAQAQITQLSESQRHAINRVTAGRACLGAAAVSLLNHPDVPAPGADAAAASSAADASGPAATDADVLGWAITASASHEQCRTRLDALIDWYEGNNDH